MLEKFKKYKETDIEHTLCPVCGGNHSCPEFKFDPFSVNFCKNCRTYFLNPRIKEEKLYEVYSSCEYFDDYSGGSVTGYADQEIAFKKAYRNFLQILKSRKIINNNSKILEIGCAYGYFLEEAKKICKYVIGVDCSEDALKTASAKADMVFQGNSEQIPQEINDLDLIISFNVIEHVYKPEHYLKEAYSRLKPGGHKIFVTPDIGNFWFKLLGKKWIHFKPPEHVCFYNKHNAKIIMEKAGFKNVKVLPFPQWYPLSLILSKLKINSCKCLNKIPVRIPTDMLAVVGEKV